MAKNPPNPPQNTPFYIYALKYPFDSFLEQNTHFYPPKHTLLRGQKNTPKHTLLGPKCRYITCMKNWTPTNATCSIIGNMASLLPSYEDILAENKELKEKLALATATLDVRLKQHQLYHERIDRLERIVFSLQEKLSKKNWNGHLPINRW